MTETAVLCCTVGAIRAAGEGRSIWARGAERKAALRAAMVVDRDSGAAKVVFIIFPSQLPPTRRQEVRWCGSSALALRNGKGPCALD